MMWRTKPLPLRSIGTEYMPRDDSQVPGYPEVETLDLEERFGMPMIEWPKLIEGHTYSYAMTQPGHMTIERTWTVRGPNTIDSAKAFKRAIATWTRRGNWTVVIKEVSNGK